MGELFSMKFAGLNGDEWKTTKGVPVILECLKDNSMIEIIDTDDKIHKTKATEKQSYICRDTNPKVIRKVFDMSGVFEHFVCKECSKKPRYSNPTFEETIRWSPLK